MFRLCLHIWNGWFLWLAESAQLLQDTEAYIIKIKSSTMSEFYPSYRYSGSKNMLSSCYIDNSSIIISMIFSNKVPLNSDLQLM